MVPSVAALVALQALDSAADAARKRLSELPGAEQAIAAQIAEAAAAVERAKATLAANQQTRRALEKEVAAVDARLARFDDHKAAVKTNHEYTALLHEIQTAKQDKDAVEEKLLVEMEAGDDLTRLLKEAETAAATARQDAGKVKTGLVAERGTLEEEITRLTQARKGESAPLDARSLALYEQLRKGRRGVAVAGMTAGVCNACHVRLRPHVEQQIKRNDSIVQCDSCQRILYYKSTESTKGTESTKSSESAKSSPQ